MEHNNTTHTVPGFRIYFFSWLALVILAAASILVISLETGVPGIVIALIIATVKALLILYFFMHLKYEGRFLKLAFLLPLIVFAFSILFTFLDILYR